MIDPVGERMKTYESVTKVSLTNRLPVIVRIDGKAFHTFTRGFERPFDEQLTNAMRETTMALCEEVQNCRLGYVQSDEISLLLVPYEQLETQPYFGNDLQKIVSITASIATAHFNKAIKRETGNESLPLAMFDSRAFVMPPDDVENYFLWRMKDCQRNAINSVGQCVLGKKNMHGLKTVNVLDKLKDAGVDYESYPAKNRNGTTFYKKKIRISEIQKGNSVPKEDRDTYYFGIKDDIDYRSPEGREVIRGFVKL